MKTESILHTDLLDIVFENRNKSYGAYTLRKFYNNRMYKALGLTFVAVGLLCSFTLIKNDENKKIFITGGYEPILPQVLPKDKPVEKVKEMEKTTAKAAQTVNATTMGLTVPKITRRNIDVPKISTIDDNTVIDNLDRTGDPSVKIKVGTLPSGIVDTGIVTIKKIDIDVFTPNEVADVQPTFPGGMGALRNFLQKHLVNPADVEEGQEVSVRIKFVVGYDGALKSFETTKDGGSVFNNEVIRVLKKMPNWTPGKIGTQNVSVYYTIPVIFRSQD
jgi:periplasmic protein TonB